MRYIPVNGFFTNQKGKYVRFKAGYIANNLSQQFGIVKGAVPVVKITPGNVGLVYEVRGATMFIGFGNDLNIPPPKSTSATRFAATIQLYINDSHKIEVEA